MNLIPIDSFDDPALDVYARLTENQLKNRKDPKNAMFIAESPIVIERALDSGCVPVSFLMETKHALGKGRILIERCGEIPVYTAELEVLTKLTGFHLTRGMLCCMLRPPLKRAEEICAGAKRIAVLENVMNPTNIGAICGSSRDGRFTFDRRGLRSSLQKGDKSKHGDCIPDTLGISRR